MFFVELGHTIQIATFSFEGEVEFGSVPSFTLVLGRDLHT